MIAVKKKYSYPFTLFILTFLPIFRSLSEPIYTEEMLINEAANTPKKLHIYNWADYINPDALLNFEREFGIDITYDTYDSSEMVDTKLLTGKSGYDIVVHAASSASRLVPIGILHEIDVKKLPNWRHLDRDLVDKITQNYSNDLIGVPFFWGSAGIIYNVDMIKKRMENPPTDSGAIIFDPNVLSKFADCGVSFLDDALTVIPMAMIYLGYPANSVDTDHLKDVEKLLKSVRPYITYFSSTKLLLDLPNEEVCIAMGWSGDYSVANQRARDVGLKINLQYIVPKEGSEMWFDNIYIPSDAKHIDNAYLFLNYMLRPEVIAATSDYIGYANANKSATPLVDKRLTEDNAIYPDKKTIDRLQTSQVLSPKEERKRSRTWTRIKTGL